MQQQQHQMQQQQHQMVQEPPVSLGSLLADSPQELQASQELRDFLRDIKEAYVGYAEQLHHASYESITELAAATPEQLVQYAQLPIGPAGAIIKAAAAEAAAAGVRQTGSLESGEIYVNVLMENDGKQLHAGLLVDTGCNLPLNISDYKADQLGLPLNGDCARLEMAQGNMGVVQRRGTVLTAVLLEGEGAEIIKDPHRSRYLEVWTDADTGSGTSGGGSSGSSGGSKKSGDVSGAASVLTIKMLSPINKGRDSRGYDAILGAPGMAALGLGIDRDTMRLYRKQSSNSFRKLGRKVARTPPAPEQQ